MGVDVVLLQRPAIMATCMATDCNVQYGLYG